MSNNLAKDEIDLLEIALVVWKKKWQIFIFMIASLAIVFVSQFFKEPKTLIINTKTEIRPISVHDEAKYKIYNSIIKSIRPFYTTDFVSGVRQNDSSNIRVDQTNLKSTNYQIISIDKDFLLNLFIDKMNEKSHLINLIKKFNYIKRENYSNKLDYLEELKNLAYSTKLSKSKKDNNFFINLKTDNIDNVESFLRFIETETNIEIQKKLYEMLNNYLNYAESIRKFQIEDIETQLSITFDEKEKLVLEKKKSILKSNKYSLRIENIFDSSPISKPNEFYAARIIYNLTDYKIKNNKRSNVAIYLTTGICGAILGIFFVLIVNAIQNRKNK